MIAYKRFFIICFASSPITLADHRRQCSGPKFELLVQNTILPGKRSISHVEFILNLLSFFFFSSTVYDPSSLSIGPFFNFIFKRVYIFYYINIRTDNYSCQASIENNGESREWILLLPYMSTTVTRPSRAKHAELYKCASII